jgi:hypothetical protein
MKGHKHLTSYHTTSLPNFQELHTQISVDINNNTTLESYTTAIPAPGFQSLNVTRLSYRVLLQFGTAIYVSERNF